jgi:hypothetical protein
MPAEGHDPDPNREVSRYDRVWIAKRIRFERLYRDWLAAQAAYADPDGTDDDGAKDPLYDNQDAAELALLGSRRPPRRGSGSNGKSLSVSSPPTLRMVVTLSRTASSPPSAP